MSGMTRGKQIERASRIAQTEDCRAELYHGAGLPTTQSIEVRFCLHGHRLNEEILDFFIPVFRYTVTCSSQDRRSLVRIIERHPPRL